MSGADLEQRRARDHRGDRQDANFGHNVKWQWKILVSPESVSVRSGCNLATNVEIVAR
jgi:hypothetical protein